MGSKRNYVIWAQPLTRSHGTRVLYMLCDKLRKKGYTARLFCPLEHRPEYEYVDIITAEMRAHDIIVYPEIVSGNPLRFQHVARFVLYFPGVLAGEKTYYPDEMIFTWDGQYYPTAHWLGFPSIDRALFFDENLPKTQDCYFINKRGRWKDIEEIRGATEINMNYPATRPELAHLLKTTRTLYSFEDSSILHEEAVFCGAKVKIVTPEGFKDYKPYFDSGNEAAGDKPLDNFIRLTQAMQRNGPLQPEESYFHLYTGIFYHAAARCAALGAWDEALQYCRKAFLGHPLAMPDFDLTNMDKHRIKGLPQYFGPVRIAHMNLNQFIPLVTQRVAAQDIDNAIALLTMRIKQSIAQGAAPVVAALFVLLAHCHRRAGRQEKAAEAENFAILADPHNAEATHLAVVRALGEGRRNQALYLAVRLMRPWLAPLDVPHAMPGLALLGLIAAESPTPLLSIAARAASMYNAPMKKDELPPQGATELRQRLSIGHWDA